MVNRTKGIFLTIFSACSFGFIPLFAKVAYANGFNPFTFSLFRSIFASIALFILLRILKIDYQLKKENYVPLFKVSLFGYSLAILTLSLSYKYMLTGLATTIHFIYPVFVLMGSIIFFHESANSMKIFSLVISLTGMYFLIGFGSIESMSMIGMLFSFLSGIFYAYYIVIVAYGNLRDINPFVLIFYVSLFNSLILLAINIVTGNFVTGFNLKGIVYTMLIAFIANLIGMVAFKAGLEMISASTAAILSTFEPVTSLILGILFLKENLSWQQMIGSFFIILSVSLIAFGERSKNFMKIRE